MALLESSQISRQLQVQAVIQGIVLDLLVARFVIDDAKLALPVALLPVDSVDFAIELDGTAIWEIQAESIAAARLEHPLKQSRSETLTSRCPASMRPIS